jgi:hypothetical protein
MGSIQVKIDRSESGKKLILVGMERMSGVGRILAAFFFFIIGLVLVQTILFTDLRGSYSLFVGHSDLAEQLVTPLMAILISLALILLLISYLTWEWLGIGT